MDSKERINQSIDIIEYIQALAENHGDVACDILHRVTMAHLQRPTQRGRELLRAMHQLDAERCNLSR